VKYGAGALNIDLVLIDLAGFDLAENPYALNETIRVMSRITFPFAVLLVVGYLTRPEDEPLLARFYGKMRTPVLADPEADRAEMEKTLADPHRFDDQKLFPRSSWEINRWNRVDGIGFIIALAVMFGILGLLYLLSLLG
jgi:SSS family solute:Na+ symporter